MNFLKYSKLIIIIINNNNNKNQVTQTGADPGIFSWGGGGGSKLWFRKDF